MGFLRNLPHISTLNNSRLIKILPGNAKMEAGKHESSSCTMKSECISDQPINEVLLGESKTSILDEIVKDLTEQNIVIFGVYGSCSFRKANMLAQMRKTVETDGLFDAVVVASEIRHLTLKGIQEELGEQLGLQLNEITTRKERARCLSDKIKTKEKILIMLVLEDLNGGIDLAEIGIPFGNDHKGSKILLIAQTRELLSDRMKTQKEYSSDNLPTSNMLIKGGKYYQPMSYMLVRLEGGGYAPNGREIPESMKPKLNEIIRALRQTNMRIVGVYGSSHATKRLVVEEITRRVERHGMFDVVVMASVVKKNTWFSGWRKSINVRKIQEELANQLDLQLLRKTSVKERAARLCDAMKTKEMILIILELDDLQSGLDLGEIGIPFGNDHLGSKIMLLAHTQKVLSNQMNAPQIEFSVDD